LEQSAAQLIKTERAPERFRAKKVGQKSLYIRCGIAGYKTPWVALVLATRAPARFILLAVVQIKQCFVTCFLDCVFRLSALGGGAFVPYPQHPSHFYGHIQRG
jgi:hypothetical protein